MDAGAVRRVLIVLFAYLATAWVVLRAADWLAGLLALPPLFDQLLLWGVALGFPAALAIAWKYPEIGHYGGDGPADE